MKVALITSFQTWFLQRHIYPQFKRRGIEIVLETTAKRIGRVKLENRGIEVVLHMTEVGPHSDSYKLSEACRKAGIPLRSLSRKKASWDFLPPPALPDPEDEQDVPHPAFVKVDDEPVQRNAVSASTGQGPDGAELDVQFEPKTLYEEDLEKLVELYEAESVTLKAQLAAALNPPPRPAYVIAKADYPKVTEAILLLHSECLFDAEEAAAKFRAMLG